MNIKDFKMTGSSFNNLNASNLHSDMYTDQPMNMKNFSATKQALGQANETSFNIYQQQDMAAKQTADEANSPTGIAKETVKGTVNTLATPAMKFLKSAVAAPIDAVRSLFGKKPVDMGGTDAYGNPVTTIQQDADTATQDVMAGNKTPLQATGELTASTVGGAADVLGLEGGIEKVVKTGSEKLGGALTESELAANERAARSTMEPLNKKGRIETLEGSGKPGGATRSGITGKVEPKLTLADVQRGKDVKPYLTSDPVKSISNINQEITRFSEKSVKPYLDANPRAFNLKTFNKAIDSVKPDFTYEGDPSQRVYNQVTASAKGIADKFGGTTSQSWEARKAFDEWAQSVKKGVFNENDQRAFNQAVADTRRRWNGFIGEQLGDSKFSKAMERLSNLFEARGNIAETSNQIVGESRPETFVREHKTAAGVIKKGLKYGTIGVAGAVGGAEAVKHLP